MRRRDAGQPVVPFVPELPYDSLFDVTKRRGHILFLDVAVLLLQ